MKRIISVLTGLCMFTAFLCGPAAITSYALDTREGWVRVTEKSGTCGDNITWVLDTNGTLTISGSGKMYDYDEDNPTPFLGAYYPYIKKIIVQGKVTHIGNSAFESCQDAVTVTLPDSVTSIGYRAFAGCCKMTNFKIPSKVTVINNEAFRGCDGLTSLTIPEGVTSIGEGAFSGCDGLTSLTIPEGVTSIGDYAFNYCSGLTSVTIPESVTSIGNYAFVGSGWYNNQSDGLLYLDNWLIGYKGEKPEGKLMIAQGTRGIAAYAFSGCSGLTSVTIPNSVTCIGNYAFSGCSGLTSITIPNSVTSIGGHAFDGCI